MITLVMFDLITKINEFIQDHAIFPTAFGIGFEDLKDGRRPKTRRAKMVSIQEFKQDQVICYY